GFKVGSLVQKYELSQSTISTILKAGDAVKKAGTGGHADHRKRVRDPLNTDVEEALYKWFLTTRTQNVPITGPILAAKAKAFTLLKSPRSRKYNVSRLIFHNLIDSML
ncbi:hypothetical protein HPB47_014500, partial [Ixodes persulcatus]